MSAGCQLYYADQSGSAYLDGSTGSWSTEFPLSNVQEARLSAVARSNNTLITSTLFFVDYNASISTDAVFLVGTNLTATSTWRITGYVAGSSPDTPTLVYNSGIRTFWPSGTSSPDQRVIRDPDGKGSVLFGMLGQLVTAQYWGIELLDTANPDGYVELAKLFMGTRLNTTRNFAGGANFQRDPNTQSEKALGGALYFNRHRNIRSWNFSYPYEDYATAWDEIDTMGELCGINEPLFVIPFPDDVDRMQKHSFLCTISEMNALEMLAVGETRVSTGFALREIV